MLNFMGLGFNFGGKDAGLTKAIDIALTSVSKFTAGIQGVSEELGDLAKKGRDPTTDFEARMTANNVMLTSMGANLGKTGKALTDFTGKSQSLALTMNRGEAETANAIGQFDRMRGVMVKTGIDSEKTLLKIADVSHINASVFADSSMQLAKMQGMTKEAGADILDTMTAAGQAMGDVAGSLGDAAARTALLQKRSALLAQGFKGIGIEEFSKQIDATTVSFQKATGASAATARAFGTGLAESIQDSAQAFKELTVGVGTDIPEGLKGLALTTGDIGTAFSNMEDGPEGFMKTMKNLTKNMGGDKEKIGQLMTWIQGQTGKAFGPERAKEIVNMLMLTTEASETAGKAVKTATGALKKYGEEGYKNGRTAAEAMKLSEDLFVTGIRAANNTAWEFANGASKSFGDLGKDIQALAKDKGGVGDLTRSLIDLNHKGLVGLFPKDLQGEAVAMGGMFEMLGKTLAGIMNPLSGIESMLMLFTVAMRSAYKVTDKTKGFIDRLGMAFESVGNRFVTWFQTLPDKITDTLNNVEDTLKGVFAGGGADGKWGKIFRGWWQRILTVFTAMGPIIKRLKTFATDFWTGFTSTLSSDPAKDSLGVKAGKWLGEIWDGAVQWFDSNVWEPIKKFGKDFWAGITTALDPDVNESKDKSAGTKLGEWFRGLGDTISNWWKEPVTGGRAMLIALGEDFWGGLTDGLDPSKATQSREGIGAGIGKWVGEALKIAIDTATDFLSAQFEKLLLWLAKKVQRVALAIGTGGLSELGIYITDQSTKSSGSGQNAETSSSDPRQAQFEAKRNAANSFGGANSSGAMASLSAVSTAVTSLASLSAEQERRYLQIEAERKDRELEMIYYQKQEAQKRGTAAYSAVFSSPASATMGVGPPGTATVPGTGAPAVKKPIKKG